MSEREDTGFSMSGNFFGCRCMCSDRGTSCCLPYQPDCGNRASGYYSYGRKKVKRGEEAEVEENMKRRK